MELEERIPLIKIKWLATFTLQQFEELCITKKTKKADISNIFEQLMSFCKTNLKTKGKTKRIYSYSKNASEFYYEGRLYSGGSIQGISSIIRGFLMKKITTDIDMSNSFANIIRYVCKKHGISTPELEYYINHREECLVKFENRQDGKQAYISSAYSDKLRDKITIPEFKKFDKEMKGIQKKITEIEEYKEIVSSVPEEKKNKLGSAFNRIIIEYENQILQYLVQFFANNNIEICTLMFDGLLIYGDYYNDQELIDNITAYSSIALGARIIEKHFTLDRNGGGPDDKFSLEQDEFGALCQGALTSWKSLGIVNYSHKESEKGSVKFRRSLYFIKEMVAGDIITSSSIKSVRPGFGLAPNNFDQIIGKRVTSDVSYGTPVSWSLIEN